MIVSKELLELRGFTDEESFMNFIHTQNEGTLIEALDMKYEELSLDRVVISMPVGPKTKQPAGLLHGGASVALAETAASVATTFNIDLSKYNPVGLEINANHVRGIREGIVTAIATPLHKGRTTMIWEIKIVDENEKLICISRCTMAIVGKR